MTRQRSSDGYTLQELTDETGVTSRTVRYYVSEGLLPPPVAAGPRSYYSEDHLQRLRLIGFLKDAYLPLREIRHRLQELNDGEVEDAIQELGVEREVERPRFLRVEQSQPPLELEESDSAYAPQPALGSLEPQTWPFVASRPGEYADRVPEEPAWRLPRPVKAARQDPPNSTVWRKLTIGDSAEFVIEDQLYQRRKEQIDALVAWAQRILEGN